MAINKQQKKVYDDESREIKKEVNQNKNLIKDLKLKIRKNKNLAGYYNLEIALNHIKNIKSYFEMNKLSKQLLNMKQSSVLDEAKREFSNMIIALEDIVGSEIDRSLKENDEFIARIDRMNPNQTLELMRTIFSIYDTLVREFGEGSKWKWSFVEMQARAAVILKNMISFSDIQRFRDPGSDYFYERRDLMQLCKESITEAAKQYRTKYEIGGKARDDLKRSIELLESLRKIHAIFGEKNEAEKLKNTIEAAKQTLEAEDKSSDAKKK